MNCSGCRSGSMSAETSLSTANTAEDKIIQEFDKFMDDYVKTLKKSMTGDASVTEKVEKQGAEYADLLRKLETAESFTQAQKEKMEWIIADKFITTFQ